MLTYRCIKKLTLEINDKKYRFEVGEDYKQGMLVDLIPHKIIKNSFELVRNYWLCLEYYYDDSSYTRLELLKGHVYTEIGGYVHLRGGEIELYKINRYLRKVEIK